MTWMLVNSNLVINVFYQFESLYKDDDIYVSSKKEKENIGWSQSKGREKKKQKEKKKKKKTKNKKVKWGPTQSVYELESKKGGQCMGILLDGNEVGWGSPLHKTQTREQSLFVWFLVKQKGQKQYLFFF